MTLTAWISALPILYLSKLWIMIQRLSQVLLSPQMGTDYTINAFCKMHLIFPFLHVSYHRKPMPDISCFERIFFVSKLGTTHSCIQQMVLNSYHIQSTWTFKKQGEQVF